MRLIPLLLAAILLTSCAGEKKDEPTTPASTEENTFVLSKPLNTFAMTENQMENPTNAIVSVSGRILRQGDLALETRMRLRNVDTSKLPPETMVELRAAIVEQFITHALLLNEAEKRKLSASEEELEAEFELIMANLKATQQLPPGTTMDAILNANPLGRETMVKQVRNKISINKVNAAIVKNNVKVSDKEIDEFIEQNQGQLEVPERVTARHILLLFAPTDDDKAKKEKKKKIKDIRKKILKGADFAEMAKQHSECGTAKGGGLLPEFPRGKMVPEFDKAAFSQKEGKVGDIVTTKFGYHIIKVDKHTKAGIYPREQIEEQIKNIKAKGVWTEYLKTLRDAAEIKYFSS